MINYLKEDREGKKGINYSKQINTGDFYFTYFRSDYQAHLKILLRFAFLEEHQKFLSAEFIINRNKNEYKN